MFLTGVNLDHNPPTCASQVAGITGTHLVCLTCLLRWSLANISPPWTGLKLGSF
jgi:hypothetical protein